MLLDATDVVLDEHKNLLERQSYFSAMLHNEFLLCVLGAIIQFINGRLASSDNRYYNSIATAALLLLVASWNLLLYVREARLTQLEVVTRVETIVESLRESSSFLDNTKVADNIPTVAIAHVIRDGALQSVPWSLLVECDILILHFGDVTPGRVINIPAPGMSRYPNLPEFILEKGETLDHDIVALWPYTQNHDQMYFQLTETPLLYSLKSALSSARPETVIIWQLRLLNTIIVTKAIWFSIVISLAINTIRFAIRVSNDPTAWHHCLDMLLGFQVNLLIIVLPLWLPTMCLVARSYGNAQILSLLEALQNSNAQFEDAQDVDEFDAAPPPTKNIATSWRPIVEKFLDQLVRFDVEFLARTTGLIDSLADTTVICSIDREGTVSKPFPSVDKVFNLGESGDAVILDVVELPHYIKFEDDDWEDNLESLKPLAKSDAEILKTIEGFTMFLCAAMCALLDKVCIFGIYIISGCLCHLSRAMGFLDEVVTDYSIKMRIQTFAPFQGSLLGTGESNYEVPNMFSQVFEDLSTRTLHLMTDGDVQLVVQCCDNYWNGKSLEPMTPMIKRKIMDFYQNAKISDMEIVAYAFGPLDEPARRELKSSDPNQHIYLTLGPNDSDDASKWKSSAPEKNEILNHFQLTHQTFLSMISFCHNPKPNVVSFIEDLGLAGIRFVYFSSLKQRESKAYAERLGLEIDWNACILLSAPDDGNGYIELHDIKAQLPRGVQNIRDHLKNVDDIPLHVSLFAECSPPSIREMIKIFQEQGEVVLVVGSSMNLENVECFSLADIAVAVDPINTRTADSKISILSAGSFLSTIPCAATLQFETSVYSLTQLIREARTLAENSKQAFQFYIGCIVCLITQLLASYLIGFPPIYNGYQLMWLAWVILPLLAFSFQFTSHDPEVMTYMSRKNTKSPRHIRENWNRLTKLFYRFLPLATINLAVFALCILNFVQQVPNGIMVNVYGYTLSSWPYVFSNPIDYYYQVEQYSQHVSMLIYVVHAVFISASFLRRKKMLYQEYPWNNKPWAAAGVLSIVLQVFFSVCFLAFPPANIFSFARLPWYVWFIGLASLPFTVAIQEYVKTFDTTEFVNNQRRLKLEFNTKLGMHSPL